MTNRILRWNMQRSLVTMRSMTARVGARAKFCIASLAVFSLVLAAQPLVAQTMLSNFTGEVTDSSGAAIPKATITVTNQGTGAIRTAETDSTGGYRIEGVLVGNYSLKVEAPGFGSYEQTNIALTPELDKRVDVILQVGQVKQTVEVTTTVPVLQTDSAVISSSLPSNMYAETPLVTMSRGAIINEMLQWAPGTASGKSQYQFEGNRPDMLQTNTEGLQFYYISGTVAPSSISDVTAVLTNAPAEYARPETLNVTLKSGTNVLHGEYWRAFVNPCLNSVDTPFSRPARAPCVTSWRQFVDVGGPVVIPNVYDGRNKTFFFFTWAKPNSFNTELSPTPTLSYPSQAMQGGDFSHYPIPIYDPLTGAQFQYNGVLNIIPPNRINAVATNIINAFYKIPAVMYVGGSNNYVNNAQILQYRYRQDTDWAVKIDQNIKTKDVLSAFWQRNGVISDTEYPYYGNYFDTAGQDKVLNWASGIVWTHTFSPHIINELRVGVTRFNYPHCQLSTTNVAAGTFVDGAAFLQQFGIQGVPNVPNLCGMPQLSITNWQSTHNDNETLDLDTRWPGFENLSFVEGPHTFKVGASFTKLLQDGPASGPYFGSFNFTGAFTAKSGVASSGDGFADFLLGVPYTYSDYATRPIVAMREWEDGFFFQDDYKVNRKLTLNYGIRWDKYTVPYDKNGLYYNFDPTTLSIVVPDNHALQNVSPAWPSATFPVKLASQDNYPAKLINGSSSWQPRLGFAYMFTEKTVLRGGFGVYNGAQRFNSLQTTGPFAVTESYTNQLGTNASCMGVLYCFPNPFPTAVNLVSRATATGYAKNYHPAYSMNWNLTLERQFLPNWGVQATYRGVKNTQLLWSQNLNSVQASTTTFSQSELPYPNLQAINLVQNGGNSYYDAAYVQVNHPFANGAFMTLRYERQWSGGLPGPNFAIDESATTPEYAFNRDRDEGPDAAFPSQDFIWDYEWRLPFGRGQKYGSTVNRILDGFIGHWTVVGAVSWRSGWFFTPTLNGIDVGNIGNTSGRRPNVVPGCNPYSGAHFTVPSGGGNWFNTACFTTPPNGQLGNAGVNSLVGPGASQVELSPEKEFPFRVGHHEGAKLVIAANIDDLFNTNAFNVPSGVINSANAGAVNTPVGGQITGITYSRGINNDEGCCGRHFVINGRIIF